MPGSQGFKRLQVEFALLGEVRIGIDRNVGDREVLAREIAMIGDMPVEDVERARAFFHPVVEGMALQVSHLGDLVGWFTTDCGTINEVVHIWRYKDMGDRERRRAAMEADPAWQAFRKKTSSYVVQMRNRILRPTSFSPMQ